MPTVMNDAIELYYETFGIQDDPVVVCLPGMGNQLLIYPEAFCMALVDRGFFVIRVDNRDAGLSSITEDGDEYTLSDMADDVVAVLPVRRRCHLFLRCQLQRIQHTQDLREIPSRRHGVRQRRLDSLIGPNDEHRSCGGIVGCGVWLPVAWRPASGGRRSVLPCAAAPRSWVPANPVVWSQ